MDTGKYQCFRVEIGVIENIAQESIPICNNQDANFFFFFFLGGGGGGERAIARTRITKQNKIEQKQ